MSKLFKDDRMERMREPAPRGRVVSTMAGLACGAGEIRLAEGYMLELLAHAAFGPKPEAEA